MKNHPSLSDLRDMDAAQVMTLPAEVLKNLMDEADEQKRDADTAKAFLASIIQEKYRKQISEAYALKDEPLGLVKVVDNNATIKVNKPKRPQWDQEKLAELSTKIRDEWNENPAEYLDTKYSVSEKAYTSWPTPLRNLFAPARMVKTGKPTITIEITE